MGNSKGGQGLCGRLRDKYCECSFFLCWDHVLWDRRGVSCFPLFWSPQAVRWGPETPSGWSVSGKQAKGILGHDAEELVSTLWPFLIFLHLSKYC